MLRVRLLPCALLILICTSLGLVAARAADERYTVSQLPATVDRIAPVSVAEIAPGKFFVDFGQAAFARLELTIPDPHPGQQVGVSLGEALSGPQTIDRHPGGSIRFLATGVTLGAARQVYLPPPTPKDQRLMTDATGPVMPFRYVEVEGVSRSFGKDDIRQLAVHYPFDDNAAQFDCADPKLTAIWRLCKHTINATSFGGIFVDGDRERKPYEADAYINALGWYCCTPDVTLPRYTWQNLVTHPTWPTEWILFSVLLAWEDYQHTGDTAGLERFYGDLQAKTLRSLERADGLISTVEPMVPADVLRAIHLKEKMRDIVDWPAAERDGCEMKPFNTVVNAFHIVALQRMAAIARALNHPDDAASFQAAAAKALESFNAKLFDPSTGLYVDGEGSAHSSLHANFFPLAFGLAPPARQGKIAAWLASREMACSVYGAQFFLQALFEHGRADRAIALMTAPGDRSWTHMLDLGATMTWEAWDRKYKPNLDWNHAWGAAPANLIPRCLMGVEPLAPGFAKVSISPHPGSLAWAEMRMPTALGGVRIRFENKARFRLEVELPARMTARVGLPVCLPDGPAGALVDGQTGVRQRRCQYPIRGRNQPGPTRHRAVTAPAGRAPLFIQHHHVLLVGRGAFQAGPFKRSFDHRGLQPAAGKPLDAGTAQDLQLERRLWAGEDFHHAAGILPYVEIVVVGVIPGAGPHRHQAIGPALTAFLEVGDGKGDLLPQPSLRRAQVVTRREQRGRDVADTRAAAGGRVEACAHFQVRRRCNGSGAGASPGGGAG